MIDRFLSLIAPHQCLGCRAEGSLWCGACRSQALPVVERCYKCHALSVGGRTCRTCRRASALFAVRAAVPYEAVAKLLVWKLKFEGAQAAARVMALIMASKLPAGDESILVVPISTASSRVRQRGYDQMRLISRELAGIADIVVIPALVRLGQQQQRNASRRQRLVQLDAAFRVSRLTDVERKHVLLIDDVITTGATLEAAARVLKRAGAKRVSALVFAQA